MKLKTQVTIATAFLAVLVGGLPLMAHAQGDGGGGGQDVGNQMIDSLDLQEVDVRDALRALFKNTTANYVVAPEVTGTVTIQLKKVKFETALRNILDQVKATYRLEGGVYQIIARNDTSGTGETPIVAPPPTAHHAPVRIFIYHADPALIIQLLISRGANTNLPPEISTVGKGGQFGGSGQGGQGGGRGGSNGGSGGYGGSGGSGGFGGSGGGGGFGGSGGGGGFGGSGGGGGFGRG